MAESIPSRTTYPVEVACTTFDVVEDSTTTPSHTLPEITRRYSRLSCGPAVVEIWVECFSGSMSPDRITYGEPVVTFSVPDPDLGLGQQKAYMVAACMIVAQRLLGLYRAHVWPALEADLRG